MPFGNSSSARAFISARQARSPTIAANSDASCQSGAKVGACSMPWASVARAPPKSPVAFWARARALFAHLDERLDFVLGDVDVQGWDASLGQALGEAGSGGHVNVTDAAAMALSLPLAERLRPWRFFIMIPLQLIRKWKFFRQIQKNTSILPAPRLKKPARVFQVLHLPENFPLKFYTLTMA